MVRIAFLTLLIGTTLTGCANNQTFTGYGSIPEEKTEVYVIRPFFPYNFGHLVNLYIDGVPVGVLRNGDFMVLSLAPGVHTATVSFSDTFTPEEKKSLDFAGAPGERLHLKAGSGLEGYFGIKTLSQTEGLDELNEFAPD